MNYVMSDIHGNYEGYCEMLKRIDLKDRDQLFVLGDVIDRGDGGIRILQDMMVRANVFPVLGNHEYMMLHCVKFLLQEITEESISRLDGEMLQGFTEWMNVGGNPTIREFHGLSKEEREELVEYLEEFTLFEEVKAGGSSFVLVHAGLSNFSADRDLEDYHPSELLFQVPDYEKTYFEDRYLVTGHLPTRAIRAGGQCELTHLVEKDQLCDDILMKNNHIAIDCGSGYGGKLGCIRLEDFKTFYV